MDRFEDIMMAAFMLIFALLGIIEIIGFLIKSKALSKVLLAATLIAKILN